VPAIPSCILEPLDQGVCSVLNVDATMLRQLQQLGRPMTPGGWA
jgi:hypothetical protein